MAPSVEVERQHYAFPLNVAAKPNCFAQWKGGYTFDEISQIRAFGDALPKMAGEVMGNVSAAELATIRSCQVSWLSMVPEMKWFYDRIGQQAMSMNRDHFGFNLWGFERAQYTTYTPSTKEGEGDFYDWHIDKLGKIDRAQRKLSLVLQLSNPQEYEGGELWLQGATEEVVPKEKGLLYAFPSYTRHRVTPVTKGIRRTLVVWCVGPEFI